MNIAMFTDCYTPTKNGVVTSILQLKEGLEERGHKVIIVTIKTSESSPNEPGIYRFPSKPFNSDIDIHLGRVKLRAVLEIIQRENIELIHTHTEFTVARSAKKAARKLNLPLVHTLHTNFHDYRHYLLFGRYLLPDFILRLAYKHFLKEYRAIICPSLKAELFLKSTSSNNKSFIVPNGADPKRFYPSLQSKSEKRQLKSKYGFNTKDKVMLSVGRIASEKRSLILVKSIMPLLLNNPDIKLLLVGSGGEREKITSLVKNHYLDQQVLFCGLVKWENMPDIYRLADLFVTASLSEICPMTIIEAMMSGLPVVARKDKALEELVQDGKNGYLVDTDEMLEEKIACLLSEKALCQKFSNLAFQISSRFSNVNYATDVEAVYASI